MCLNNPLIPFPNGLTVIIFGLGKLEGLNIGVCRFKGKNFTSN